MLTIADQAWANLTPATPKDLFNEHGLWRQSAPVHNTNTNEIIRGGLYPHQQRFWQLPNPFKLLITGYGGGKTFTGGKRVLSLALHNAPVPVAAVSPTYTVAKRTVIPTLKELLAGKQTLLGRKFKWYYHSTDHEFRIKYRGRTATIIVYSGDDPDALRGANLAASWIDEPFIQDYAVFTQMVARMRHPEARHIEMLLTGTPDALNWGYKLAQGKLKSASGKSLSVGVIQASTRDNKAIQHTDYISNLEATLTEEEAQALIEGQFVNLTQGRVFYAFNQNNVVKIDIPQGARLGIGMDFNISEDGPMAAVLFWEKQDHVHIVAEIELPGAGTEEMCEEIRARYGRRFNDVFPDASGRKRQTAGSKGSKSDFAILTRYGFDIHTNKANPFRRDRFQATNGKLRSSKRRCTLTIDPDCEKLIEYFSTYSYENMHKKEGKRISHLIDAATYPIAYLYPPIGNYSNLMETAA